ncbi:MAG: polyphosphate kinase 1 [Actinomycetota bacterium]
MATEARVPSVPSVSSVPPSSRFANRELSWLDFNARVLALAEDNGRPLLERVRFLGIFNINLDEFFQIRVAGLKEQLSVGLSTTSPDGRTAREQLDAISGRVRMLMKRQNQIWAKSVRPRLDAAGVSVVDWEDLGGDDRVHLRQTFEKRVFPILTPLSVDPAHPFPYISDLSLNLAVVARDPSTRIRRFARVKVPPNIARFMPLPDGERFIPQEQVIAANLDMLFSGMEIVAVHPFRVTRDLDLDLEIDEADDLLAAIESILRQRERSPEAVRLEVHGSMPKAVRTLIEEELHVDPSDVYVTRSLLGMSDLMELTKLERPDLKYGPWAGVTQPRLQTVASGKDIFSVIAEGDVLVHHPYDAFSTSVEQFVSQASRDPAVLAIKQTLYRTSGEDSRIVRALVRAAESGKQTVALVELTARFDEEANITWARVLEQAGVHVVYGVVGLKTHAKCSLVVREEGDEIRQYCHIGTGNYHSVTAKLYEDVGLLTDDPDITADVADLFNYLTGYSHQQAYRRILVAPITLRSRILEMIHREAEASDGHIVMKMNSLVDAEMIDALYEASQAGTDIDLIVRGICCLRPGVPGMSDNIRVRSIVGRYLEHSRIYRFGTEKRGPRMFIGSADLMPRNLDHRVECVTEVLDRDLKDRLDGILRVNLEDDVLAWRLGPDGWSRVPTERGLETHTYLQQLAEEGAR